MAGFGAKGIQNGRFVSLHTLKEARGVSFALGGDPGRVTVPNLIHYYSHDLYGSSVGDQMFTLCFGKDVKGRAARMSLTLPLT
jgi:phospholipase B1